MKKAILFVTLLLLSASCVSTKSTLKNVDDNAPNLVLSKDNTFVITAFSKDKKYGYDADFYKQNAVDGINMLLRDINTSYYIMKNGLEQIINKLCDYFDAYDFATVSDMQKHPYEYEQKKTGARPGFFVPAA